MRAGPPKLSLWGPLEALQTTSLAVGTWRASPRASIRTSSAVESLIAQGWRLNDFRHAGIEEIFNESFNNPVAENMVYLAGLMPGE